MRCENCGWDNPNENVKCEKCGAPFEEQAREMSEPVGRQPTQGFQVMGGADLKGTMIGCPECGYPIRPGDTQCPQCGTSLAGEQPTALDKQEPAPVPLKKPFGGTVIKNLDAPLETPKEKPDEPARPAGKKLVGFLVTYTQTALGQFFPLYEGRNFVGKAPENNVVIGEDESVSGKHVSILYRSVDGKFKFKDEQSVNGTFINGQLIDEGELANSDVIEIGRTQLVLMIVPKIEAK